MKGVIAMAGALLVATGAHAQTHKLTRVWESEASLQVLADGMPGGGKELLFDGEAVDTRTADIGWDPASRIVCVPTFFRNSVVAFKVE